LLSSEVKSPAATFYPAYDGNGNIAGWANGSGTSQDRRDYSPFGQLVTRYKLDASGSAALAKVNFGFSTKYTDAESGLLYYGYRYYDPVTGRWISKDPIGERGGVGLYAIQGNALLRSFDILG